MTAWLVVMLVGIGSFLFRLSMVAIADRVTLPDTVTRATAFVAPAAFAALAATGVTASIVGLDLLGALPPLAAVTVAAIAVRRTGRAYVAVVTGMPTLWLLTFAVGA